VVVSDTVLLFVLLIVLLHRAQSPDTYSALLVFWFASVFARINTQDSESGAVDQSTSGNPASGDDQRPEARAGLGTPGQAMVTEASR
jgi:hypothetical protein